MPRQTPLLALRPASPLGSAAFTHVLCARIKVKSNAHTLCSPAPAPQKQVMYVTPGSDVESLRPLPAWPTPGFSSAFSAAGGHTLLMLDPAEGYAPEVAMFGGTQDSGARAGCMVARWGMCLLGL